MRISEAYEPRTETWLGEWAILDWRFKVYTIAYGRDPVDADLIDAARVVATERVRAVPMESNDYKVGFVGIHQGKTGNFVFVDWWADENELHHHIYVSTSQNPATLRYMTPPGLAACVWDLRLIGFERDAWVDHVLKRPSAPDVEGYLKANATRVPSEPKRVTGGV